MSVAVKDGSRILLYLEAVHLDEDKMLDTETHNCFPWAAMVTVPQLIKNSVRSSTKLCLSLLDIMFCVFAILKPQDNAPVCD